MVERRSTAGVGRQQNASINDLDGGIGGVGVQELPFDRGTLQSIIDACGSAQTDTSIVVNRMETNGHQQQMPPAGVLKELDLAFVCKRCRLAFASETSARAHQKARGCGVDESGGGVLHVRQNAYVCKICNDDEARFCRVVDLLEHLQTSHPRNCASPLADEMENVVNQITALAAAKAAAAAATHSLDSQSDTNANIFCPASPQAEGGKKSKLFAVPNNIATPTGGR